MLYLHGTGIVELVCDDCDWMDGWMGGEELDMCLHEYLFEADNRLWSSTE